MSKPKLFRITTIPTSLEKLLVGQLEFMQSHFDITAISADKYKLNELGKANNYDTFHLEMTRKITPVKDLKAVIKLYKYLIKEKPTIVHTHTPKAGVVGMLAAKLSGVPIRLHTVAGLPLIEATGKKRWLLNLVEKLTYACATKIYPNSYGLLKIIIDNKFTNQSKLKVLANGSSNGINTEHFNPSVYSDIEINILSKKLEIALDDFVFIFIGRLVGDKGLNELVTAFSSLSLKRKNIKLLLVGAFEKDLDPLKTETLLNIDNNSNILLLGYQPDVRPYFSISDCLVFPSYREGFPNVVMQAGAMGVSSIVSNINGCNEIVEDGKNGIIIPVKNSYAIEDAMIRVITDKPQFEKMKNNSREMIVNRYEQIIVWNAILSEYNILFNNV
jgi:glycosyltransferase involved in cell wall biosynthesis